MQMPFLQHTNFMGLLHCCKKDYYYGSQSYVLTALMQSNFLKLLVLMLGIKITMNWAHFGIRNNADCFADVNVHITVSVRDRLASDRAVVKSNPNPIGLKMPNPTQLKPQYFK